ncbi:Flagellar biosynthesis protein FlhF [Fundidesulfovibrio magnetotacticus]|uniref:Flagellar biosynthesis protein FlhF n=1 Tax=Fundidesulfovibrio magnetotacticus TaxID=2730080 RepID=A0A6V8LLF5_9BACT|nr:flagellar biosynthesis protein FlhF [Fundidesulfovibrio magnetotacticus]GFK92544.1 Flagellar biosynthesis protein FlhF [Fundidesulfovibrio magnetotacticus]
MRVKTFRGASAAQVMAQIKKELGPEAVILSNQTRREDGRQICEIMAAVEPAQEVGGFPGQDSDDLPGAGPGPRGAGWEREWREMKDHLSALLKPHMSLDGLAPRQRMAMEYLEREGVDEAHLVGLLRKLKASPGVSILAELGRLARVKPYGQFHERFQLAAGPSGAGKTTVLARMALEARRLHPEKRIGILNCDGRGAGGKAILKRYAELSGITFADATEPEDFNKVLLACRNFDTIFVDLPSLPQGRTLAQWLAERSLAGRDDVAVHLVLPPYMAQGHYESLWKRHASDLVKSIVWTKLDEADSFGALINVGHMTGLPASALSYGPGAAGSMSPADSQALWRLVFSHQMPTAQTPSGSQEQAA